MAVREAILEFPEELILRKLPQILESAPENICRPGIQILSKVRHFGLIEVLERLLKSDREVLRTTAAEVALALREEEFFQPLDQAPGNGDHKILNSPVETVSEPRQPFLLTFESDNPLTLNMRAEDLFVGIETFRRMPMSISREKLLDLYAGVPERLQAAVVYALAELPLPGIFQDLKTLLEKSPSLYVKSALVTGLSSFGPQAEPLLIPLLRDDDEELLFSTVKALALVGGPSSIDALSRIREHANPNAKFFKERALKAIRARHPLA